MYYYYGFDPTYVLVLIGLLISVLAQVYVTSSYGKYKKIKSKSGLEGFEVARHILDSNGLNSIDIVETRGELTDHYDPSRKVVRLSTDVFHGNSIAAASVAAHECGHAVQDKENYFFLRLRSSILPIVNFASYAGYIAVLFGLLFQYTNLLYIGIFFELAVLVFQLITLPVEFDASKRALKFLEKEALIEKKEQEGSKKMLGAAAMTYVASVVTVVLQIVRLLLIADSRNDR